MKTVLRTERLALGPVTVADANAVFEYCQDPELQACVPVPVPYQRSDADHFTGTYATDAATSPRFSLWAIRLTDGPAPSTGPRPLVGVIELRFEVLGSAEVGFWLGAAHRGQGIMTEALRAVADFAFDREGLALTRLTWNAVVGNTSSAIVAQRNGFQYEGVSRGLIALRDRRVDAWRATLLRDDPRVPAPGWPL